MTILRSKVLTASECTADEHDLVHIGKLPIELFLNIVAPASDMKQITNGGEKNKVPALPQLAVDRKDSENLRLVSRKSHSFLHDIWMGMVKRDRVRAFELDEDFSARMVALGEHADWQCSMEHITLELPRSAFYYGKADNAQSGDCGFADTYGGSLGPKEASIFHSSLEILLCLPRLRTVKADFNVSYTKAKTAGFQRRRETAREDFLLRMQRASVSVVKEGVMSFLKDEFVPGLNGFTLDEFAVSHFK